MHGRIMVWRVHIKLRFSILITKWTFIRICTAKYHIYLHKERKAGGIIGEKVYLRMGQIYPREVILIWKLRCFCLMGQDRIWQFVSFQKTCYEKFCDILSIFIKVQNGPFPFLISNSCRQRRWFYLLRIMVSNTSR